MSFRIILLEDESNTRQVLAEFLRRQGYEVLDFHAPSGCPLYGDLSCQCPQLEPCGDLLITDNRMPVMSGLDFIRLQQQRGCQGLAGNKAVMSAFWSDSDLALAAELGCKIFHKPLKLNELLQWIAQRAREAAPAPVPALGRG